MSHTTTSSRIYVVGLGLVSPAGRGVDEHLAAMQNAARWLGPLSLFEGPHPHLPVGQVAEISTHDDPLPRTHRMALEAAVQALDGSAIHPDAIILGGTTGGMPLTEDLLRKDVTDPAAYTLHGPGSVAALIAAETGIAGPALTASTACSSGAVALTLALEMLRTGQARCVLAGGVDALCRLTYHGFRMLQLIDPAGTRPLATDRAGMTVGEAAAMLLLVAADEPPPDALAILAGGGLSCDAYHPSAPHPEGAGARAAIQAALSNAGFTAADVDYVNLHGTGTRDNDASEARALHSLFPDGNLPRLSSVKGTFGHSLAAAGALEAALAVLMIQSGWIPANVGSPDTDPELGLAPVARPEKCSPQVILSNSFGFGGNNAALVLSHLSKTSRPAFPTERKTLTVLGSALLTGGGHTRSTLTRLAAGRSCAGVLPESEVVAGLPPRSLRRMKRLPRLVLALANAVLNDVARELTPRRMVFGTGWGPQTETYDFLTRLEASGDVLSSPTDFVGSVHNSTASQLAMKYGATGANVTVTNGDESFAHALFTASLLAGDEPLLLCGADEAHEVLTPRLDASTAKVGNLADGGAALLVRPAFPGETGPLVKVSLTGDEVFSPDFPGSRYAALLAGIPAALEEPGETMLRRFLEITGFAGPVVRYRSLLGEFATVSAAATALAVEYLNQGCIPGSLLQGSDLQLDGKGILVLELTASPALIEVIP